MMDRDKSKMEWNSGANKDHVYNVSQVLLEFIH